MALAPNWHALNREAELSAELIAGGVTALGSADHACLGLYSQAFFGLTIGLERLAKLVIIVDHAAAHDGRFPDNRVLRKFSHGLTGLLDACEEILARYPADPSWGKRPSDAIHQEMIRTLDEFATLSRYYNLDAISGGNASRLPEPTSAWWQRLSSLILERHYSSKMRERDKANAAAMESLFADRATVFHFSETEEPIGSMTALMLRAGATRVMQRYGRMYSLQIVRWLVEGLSVVARTAAAKGTAVSGLAEPFVLFRNEDDYLRSRKTWSIYRP